MTRLACAAPLAQPPAPPHHGDASNPAPQTAALQIAWAHGRGMGVQVGYTQGWRYGVLCGAVGTLAATAAVVGLVWVALQAGGLSW
jgi:hypothetical protein